MHACTGFCAREDGYIVITLAIAFIRINANITIFVHEKEEMIHQS